MFKSITINKGIKHTGKTFNFTEGLNTISGENEAGKSYIIEMINFACFGVPALRKPANTYSYLDIEVILCINGTEYKIIRTLKGAEMWCADILVAKGTSPVNQEVVRKLGYGFEVYKVANYAGQTDIQYLSSLGATERRRIIENVIGLSAIEKVYKDHKEELNFQKRSLSSWEAKKPVQVPMPTKDVSVDYLDELGKMIAYHKDRITTLKANKAAIEAVERTKPAEMFAPAPLVLNLTVADIQVRNTQITHEQGVVTAANNRLKTVGADVTKQGEYIANIEKEVKTLKETIETLPLPATEERIAEVTEQWRLWGAAHEKESLMKRGHIDCSACNHRNYLAADSLKAYENISLNPTVPDIELKVLKAQGKERLEAVKELEHQLHMLTTANEKLADLNSKLELYAKEAAVAENSLNQLKTDWYSDDLLISHIQLLGEHEKYNQYLANLKQYKLSVASLPQFNAEDLAESVGVHEKACTELHELNKLSLEWDTYHASQSAIQNHENESKKIQEAINAEVVACETLTELQSLIKSGLLPSINGVASTWLTRISDGLHSTAELTQDMDILVDGDMIEGLSGSGKAIGHLSLRMALGQVLTRKVFSSFIADEVDASCDSTRATAIMENILHMLNDGLKQVIIISHKRIEGADNEIKL